MITRIRSQGNPASPPSPKTSAKGIADFKAGEVFHGEIVRSYGKGDVLIRSGGSAFRAFTKANVSVGEEYEFRVRVEAGKNTPAVLEVAAAKSSMPGMNQGPSRIPTLVSEVISALSVKDLTAKTSAILSRLRHALPVNVYNGPSGDQASWLSRFLADGGLFWEGKVARSLLHGVRPDWRRRLGNDLKGLLLELKHSLNGEKKDLPEIDSAGRKLDDALDLIQKTQLENRDLLREEGCWLLQVPGRPEEGFNGAELYVRRDVKEKEIRFSMCLDFTHLGPMELNAAILHSTISIRFEVSDEKKAELVRRSLPVLDAALRDKGFIPGQLVCAAGETGSENESTPKAFRPADSINLVI